MKWFILYTVKDGLSLESRAAIGTVIGFVMATAIIVVVAVTARYFLKRRENYVRPSNIEKT